MKKWSLFRRGRVREVSSLRYLLELRKGRFVQGVLSRKWVSKYQILKGRLKGKGL